MKPDSLSNQPTASPGFFQSKTFSSWFFGALFFLGSADMFFTTHILGFNVRWGQILLFLAALPALQRLWTDFQKDSLVGKIRLKMLLAWLPFFILYGIAALYADSPRLTGIKWGWGIFNITLAALVGLNPRRNDSMERGFQGAIALICLFIWAEALAIYWFGFAVHIQDLGPGSPSAISIFSIPLGYAQASFHFMDIEFYRPCAFFYEPSFAACGLTFAFFLLFFRDAETRPPKTGFLPALVLSSLILSSSRTGILSAALFFMIVGGGLGFRSKTFPYGRSFLRTIMISALLIGLFCVHPTGRKYMEFLTGPLGSRVTDRIQNKGSSEGGRVENFKECLRLWTHHPILGTGVVPQNKTGNSGLSQISFTTWLEIALESGALGVAAFLFAILSNMRQAWKRSQDLPLKILVLAAWIVHFTVQLLLSQTFPRLDYWLLFFLSIGLLLGKEAETEKRPSSNFRFSGSRR